MLTEDQQDRSWYPNRSRYVEAQFRRAGRSGLLLPPVSLGLWQNFGADRPYETAKELLRHAFDLGVTHLDLANNYGPPYGEAERTFGEALARDFAGYRDELVVSTKAGYDMWPGPYGDGGSRKYLTASLDASLRRTGLDYVDVFYHHRRDPETPLEETAGALVRAVQAGKALYVGVSNYDPSSIREISRLLGEQHVPLTLVQPAYSLFDRRPESGVLEAAAEVGAGVAVFSPLSQGRLTDRYLDGVPTDSRATRSRYLHRDDITDEVVRRARGLHEIALQHGCTLAQLAIGWVLRDNRITTALAGASSTTQLAANVAAAQLPALSGEELLAMDEFAAASGSQL